MARHLRACEARKAHEAEIRSQGARRATLFHLVADGYRDYWLHLEMPADATLYDLDAFLRDIWLECCGHLSAFTIGNVRFYSHPEPGWGFDQGMDVRLGEVLIPKLKFTYEYDFGSTTELELRVLGQHQGWIGKAEEPVRLLARNLPPEFGCIECGKPATKIHAWEWVVLCDECAATKTDEYDPEGLMPLVNSPRAGVCGYWGPMDPERFEP
jgi:hypothetical protein